MAFEISCFGSSACVCTYFSPTWHWAHSFFHEYHYFSIYVLWLGWCHTRTCYYNTQATSLVPARACLSASFFYIGLLLPFLTFSSSTFVSHYTSLGNYNFTVQLCWSLFTFLSSLDDFLTPFVVQLSQLFIWHSINFELCILLSFQVGAIFWRLILILCLELGPWSFQCVGLNEHFDSKSLNEVLILFKAMFHILTYISYLCISLFLFHSHICSIFIWSCEFGWLIN